MGKGRGGGVKEELQLDGEGAREDVCPGMEKNVTCYYIPV